MTRIKVATRFYSRPYWGRLFYWKEGVVMESDRRFLFLNNQYIKKGEKLKMKKMITTLFTLMLILTLSACKTNESNTILVGISPDYPPYESLTVDGEMVGFDIDMTNLFSKYLKEEGYNYEFEFVQMDFDNIITQIQTDQLSVGISGFTYKEDREVEWSKPYLGTSQVALVPVDSDISSVEDLEGKSIVYQTGGTGEETANSIPNAKTTGLKNAQEIMNALGANQFDAAIIDIGFAIQYVENANFKMIENLTSDEKNYIIAKKGNTEMIELINKCIDKFIASTEYQELCQKYELTPVEAE